jgi:hypothetical protein
MASALHARFESSGFLPVGIPKTLVYAAPVHNEEALHRRTVDACQTISNCPGVLARMWRSMLRRVEACIKSHGGHSEHLLKMYSFSYNSQIKCFPTHVDVGISSCFGMCNLSHEDYTCIFNYTC